jgi:hypothetical protein
MSDFWMLRKSRFAYLVILGLLQYYDMFNRFQKWQAKKRRLWSLCYQRRWQLFYKPETYMPKSVRTFDPFQMQYQYKMLSQGNLDSLSKLMFEVDN